MSFQYINVKQLFVFRHKFAFIIKHAPENFSLKRSTLIY